ncbi:DUF6252 family protein [Algoriphagus sp. Y33]|uniref:DUF6252 family protein n=1 Tax=Algoriphagus sp. Y33 TaxID=2772483 RepID=UPI001783A9CE|nr:DUF6252 family protein [Algoriphagus sp. Y33]
MKSSLSPLYPALLLIFTMCTACDLNLFWKESKPKSELEKLPPITLTGENTFGCLINGEAMVANNSLYVTAIYQGGGVQISGRMDTKGLNQIVGFTVLDPFEINKEYDLTNLPKVRARSMKYLGIENCTYAAEDIIEGKINFSRIDRTNFVISGTFEFSASNEACDTVRMTNGRFDIQYIP